MNIDPRFDTHFFKEKVYASCITVQVVPAKFSCKKYSIARYHMPSTLTKADTSITFYGKAKVIINICNERKINTMS